MKGIYIELKDIIKIRGVHINTASKQYRRIKDTLNKKKITVEEYCEIEGITKELFLKTVQKKRFEISLSLQNIHP